MKRTSAKGAQSATAVVARKKTRRKKPAEIISRPAPASVTEPFKDEEVTPEEMTAVAVETASTEDVEEEAETTSEGDEWPG
jgi:hypothetical protein